MKNVVIIIPTYNEAGTIKKLISQIFTQTSKTSDWSAEILIVDSKSPDRTGKIVKSLQPKNPKLHLLETNKEGLGKAYARGFEYAINKLHAAVVFEMDADFSHSPNDIPFFLGQIEKGADFVIGSRYIRGGSIPQNWNWHRKIFSFLGNIIIRLGFMKPRISDWTSGHRAIKAWVVNSVIDKVRNYSGYVFQVALLDEALKKNAKIAEVPINFKDRIYGESKINSFQYIAQTLLYVFTHSSFIKYVVVGLVGAVLDFGISYLLIEKAKIIIWLSTIISAETAIISNFLFNNFWAFSHKRLEHKVTTYLKKFFHFNLISSGSLFIQAFGIQLLAYLFGQKWWYIYKVLVIVFIIIPYSYLLYNKFVWNEKNIKSLPRIN